MATACTQGLDTGFVDLGYMKVAVLGVVQGISELLPISSTAHMRIVPALLGWNDPGSASSAAMQLAALAAVITYFWSDVRGLYFGVVGAVKRRDYNDWAFRFAVWIVLASLPVILGGLALSHTLNACGSPLRSLPVIGIACIVMAALLALAELYCNHTRSLEHITLKDAMIVGLAQVGALIPGVSRSGSTLTAALFLDLKREEAARFSFLLGLPAIAGGGVYELFKLFKAHLDGHGWSILAVGLVVASISAFAAIWSLMHILERFSAWPFVVYRAVIGVVLLVGAATHWLS
ncbi:MAG: undecaprenyl-diphosphate phosphatase [Methylocystis sp.]